MTETTIARMDAIHAGPRWSLLLRLFGHLRRKAELARAAEELYALDDRMLDDIGVTRGQIPSLLRYGRPRD